MHLFFFFFVPLGRTQPRGLEPSAVPLGGSAWSKKIPKTHPNPHLIPSNGSLRILPSHEPLQVCFGQEVRSDGFILDVLTEQC